MRAAAAIAVMVLAACGGDSKKSGPVPYDTAAVMPLDTTVGATDTTAFSVLAESTASAAVADTPVAAGLSATPTIVLRPDSAAGDMLYHGKGRCFTCHGDRGTGTSRLGPSLADSAWVDIDGSIAGISVAIANGIAAPRSFSVAMPAYSGALTPDEMTRIAEYVFLLSHPGWTKADTTHAADSTPVRTPPLRVRPVRS